MLSHALRRRKFSMTGVLLVDRVAQTERRRGNPLLAALLLLLFHALLLAESC